MYNMAMNEADMYEKVRTITTVQRIAGTHPWQGLDSTTEWRVINFCLGCRIVDIAKIEGVSRQKVRGSVSRVVNAKYEEAQVIMANR